MEYLVAARTLILLSLFYFSFAATNEYLFCENTNGTIVVELDAVIVVTTDKTNTTLKNIKQNSTSVECTTKSKRMFHIDFENDSLLKVIIEEKDDTVSLVELEVKGKDGMATTSLSKELSKSDEYYSCDRPETYKLDQSSESLQISVTFNEIKLQGFNVVDGQFSQKVATCAAEANSTTTSPPTTTKNPPTTTTTVPTTTTKQPTTTTKQITTTTLSPTTTQKVPTTTAITSTAKPTTTVSPGTVAEFDLKSGGTICLMVAFKGNLSFEYKTKEGKAHYTHTIDSKDVHEVNGSCDGDTPFVKGFLSMGCSVEFHFAKVSNFESTARRLLAASFEYALTNVTVNYDTSKPPGAVGGGVESVSSSPSNVKASSGAIYKCNAPQVLLNKGSTSLKVENFKAGAYSPDQKNANECAADSPGNNVVPIVVGIILACLVVIIIVAYLIGRRRSREGYQSV